MTAFEKWFRHNFEGCPQAGASYLINCCMNGAKDSVAWEWLKKTGDKTFTPETFVKAAKLILGVES